MSQAAIELFRVILEGADADAQARLHGLPTARQAALIEHVLGQMDGATEARDGAATRQVLVSIAQSWLEEDEQQWRRRGPRGAGVTAPGAAPHAGPGAVARAADER